ncbi:MAG: class I SAM-dependent methyltransferase [Methylococcus sp.]|nr:class I SAM-dependent methyltransferase [Methylococcus sp.]
MENRVNRCPLCEESDFRQDRLGLLICNSCSLVLSPAIWQSQVNERMEEEWFGESYEQRKSSFWVRWFEAWNNRKTLSRLAAQALSGKRLLEIGVGSGSFLGAAKNCGYEVMGCDLSAPICRQVQQQIGVPMHCGLLESLEAEGRFDAVVMNHVLEHVQRPVEFMQNVFRLLAPGGIVHVAVPNIGCWEARFYGWTSYEPYHLTYFDRQTLTRTAESAGFSLDTIITKDSFSGWFLALLRTVLGVNRAQGAITRPASLSTNGRAGHRSILVEQGYRLAMVLAGGGLWPLRWLQGQLGYGDEAICIARKRAGVSGE